MIGWATGTSACLRDIWPIRIEWLAARLFPAHSPGCVGTPPAWLGCTCCLGLAACFVAACTLVHLPGSKWLGWVFALKICTLVSRCGGETLLTVQVSHKSSQVVNLVGVVFGIAHACSEPAGRLDEANDAHTRAAVYGIFGHGRQKHVLHVFSGPVSSS